MRELDGGCTSPVCAHAELRAGVVSLRGLYYEESDGSWRKGSLEGPAEEAVALGVRLARLLRDGKEAQS